MLNELLIAERGAQVAGLHMVPRHPDIKDARTIPTLLVQLDEHGHVGTVRPVSRDIAVWTMRDGQHNSFPFVQPKLPLLALPPDDEQRKVVIARKNPERRATLSALCVESLLDATTLADWPGAGLIGRLRERRAQLASLENKAGGSVLATIDRFLLVCDVAMGQGVTQFFSEILQHLATELRQTPNSDWCDVAAALLVGKQNSKTKIWESEGAMLFDAHGDWEPIYDSRIVEVVSHVMNASDSCAAKSSIGCCGLTGETGRLVESTFPQPNLPILGQTYLFARNKDIPANDRYGRFSADSMPVGQNTIIRLASAIEALTADKREGITWRSIPGESPKQTDLLLAFVETALDAPVAGLVAGEDEADFAEEAPETASTNAGDIAAFEKRTERLIKAVQARVGADFTKTPVRFIVLRKVDPANRKVVYASTPTVGELHQAALNWAEGEKNVPSWLTLPIPKKDRRLTQSKPSHVTPLGLIGFTRQIFIRGSTQRQEVAGLPASEVLALFVDQVVSDHSSAQRRVFRVLRLVLARRASLLMGMSHALRRRAIKKLDKHGDLRREALRTITVLAVLLHKLGRKEKYMTDTAFKLGQLLAAADIVHAGYCADVRGGALPPSLLGNQIFTMAQTAPVKALATLCRRWKPYDGWARQATRDRILADKLVNSKKQEDQNRGWDIKKAVRYAREMRPLAAALSQVLADCTVNDEFRAELLLGYLAGLPTARDEDTGTNENNNHKELED